MKSKQCLVKSIATLLSLLLCLQLTAFPAIAAENSNDATRTAQSAAENPTNNAETSQDATTTTGTSQNTTETVKTETIPKTTNTNAEILINTVVGKLNLPADTDADALLKLGYISASEHNLLKNSNSNVVTLGMVWRILLPAYGIYPYPALSYENLSFLPSTTNYHEYSDAYIAAILSGLIGTSEVSLSGWVLRPQLIAIIDQLESGDFIPLDPPTPLPEQIADIEWTAENYQYRNSFLLAYNLIPRSWLETFQADGWKIICKWQPESKIGEHAKYFQKMEDNNYIGLTVFANKTIYLSAYDFRTLAHELAHYAAYRAGRDPAFLKPYYEDEAKAVAGSLSTYSQKAPEEYFAEFVAYWFEYPSRRPTLIEKAPQTTTLFLELLSDFEKLTNS